MGRLLGRFGFLAFFCLKGLAIWSGFLNRFGVYSQTEDESLIRFGGSALAKL